ncbi:MAG: MarR family transcriptional regulator [Candidatus Sumerlaeia bacterium]|nr:MarR family transcriptional regulator [Candidatus Sumerlaeia bacterium]
MVSKTLQHIKQTREFDSPKQELFLVMLRLVENLSYDLEQSLKEKGLTQTQYNALRILRGAGPNGLPSCEVGARMVKRVPDVTRLLDRLEKQGWIERERLENNRRVVMSRITPKGLQILEDAQPLIDSFHTNAFHQLTEAQAAEIIRLLDMVTTESPMPTCDEMQDSEEETN